MELYIILATLENFEMSSSPQVKLVLRQWYVSGKINILQHTKHL